ncbi:hypothetical protein QA635_18635 [Bradyrhizobium brasilense]|uniref:hypothetical protein n=1 Tax=Bradyrhizobium brasilense TaxID=1419277 RepID=UPI0024B1F57B|nr:hypothetical protein [Bradyrhizobium australafricanum]WFU36314.1 hypothetical protein QA635_18635 [Bradyrhizobium australafricanum]
MPWQAPGATQGLPISAMVANILCERHNNALSPLDAEAGRFFSILAGIEANEGRAYRHPLIDLVSGTVIEKWMLKVACGLYYSVGAQDGKKLRGSHSIDVAKAEKALFHDIWDDRAGLYFVVPADAVVRAGINNSYIAPLTDHRRFGGARVSMLGFELDLVFNTADTNPSAWTSVIHRPGELMFSSDKRTHHLLVSWPPGFPSPIINFGTTPRPISRH